MIVFRKYHDYEIRGHWAELSRWAPILKKQGFAYNEARKCWSAPLTRIVSAEWIGLFEWMQARRMETKYPYAPYRVRSRRLQLGSVIRRPAKKWKWPKYLTVAAIEERYGGRIRIAHCREATFDESLDLRWEDESGLRYFGTTEEEIGKIISGCRTWVGRTRPLFEPRGEIYSDSCFGAHRWIVINGPIVFLAKEEMPNETYFPNAYVMGHAVKCLFLEDQNAAEKLRSLLSVSKRWKKEEVTKNENQN